MKEATENQIYAEGKMLTQNNTNASDRIYKIIRGVIKKELIKRLENQVELFPISNKISIY